MSAALLPSLRDAPDAVGRRFHLDAPGWYQEPETPELLAPIAEAVWDDRWVSTRYRRGDGEEVEREGEERFTRDEDFDLAAFWAERAAEFARSILRAEVVVRLSEAGARRLPYVTDRAAAEEALAAGTRDAEGRVTATLPVESEEVAFSQLLALGAEAEVLAPAALRARFRDAARAMAESYG